MPSRQTRRTREFLEARTGDSSQIAGVRRYRLEEGRAGGASFASVWNAAGLNLTVALDRAMDISDASYRGRSLCWRSPAGDASAGLNVPQGLGWLKTFCGGLLTTCGLTHAGGPADVGGKHYGLHGEISNTPAEEVSCRTDWRGGELVVTVSGKVRQAVLFGEKLLLHRTISVHAFERRFSIHDVVENTSHERAPLMLLYHFNAGWPVVEDGSRLLVNAAAVEPLGAGAAEDARNFTRFHSPVKGRGEKVYFLTLRADRRGIDTAAVVNRARDFGFCITWRHDELPCMVEWKMMGYRDYVVGMEPCTVFIRPRAELIERELMPYLGAGKAREFHIEARVLDGRDEVSAAVKATGGLR